MCIRDRSYLTHANCTLHLTCVVLTEWRRLSALRAERRTAQWGSLSSNVCKIRRQHSIFHTPVLHRPARNEALGASTKELALFRSALSCLFTPCCSFQGVWFLVRRSQICMNHSLLPFVLAISNSSKIMSVYVMVSWLAVEYPASRRVKRCDFRKKLCMMVLYCSLSVTCSY